MSKEAIKKTITKNHLTNPPMKRPIIEAISRPMTNIIIATINLGAKPMTPPQRSWKDITKVSLQISVGIILKKFNLLINYETARHFDHLTAPLFGLFILYNKQNQL